MNKKQLKKELENLNISKFYYSLKGIEFPDRIILSRQLKKWCVFYVDDRGNLDWKKYFSTEDEACEYMLKILKNDKEFEGGK